MNLLSVVEEPMSCGGETEEVVWGCDCLNHKDEEEDVSVSCDECGRWFHYSCLRRANHITRPDLEQNISIQEHLDKTPFKCCACTPRGRRGRRSGTERKRKDPETVLESLTQSSEPLPSSSPLVQQTECTSGSQQRKKKKKKSRKVDGQGQQSPVVTFCQQDVGDGRVCGARLSEGGTYNHNPKWYVFCFVDHLADVFPRSFILTTELLTS